MKKTVLRILVLVMTAAVAFTVVHFAVLGNNSPTDTAFTFALEGNDAILTGSTDALSGAVLLPETIGGHTVVGVGENAFKDCADVTAFFLPDTITSIGAYAFENCTGLLQAILPDGLVSIGEGAFWNCSGLVSVTVPASVTSIGSCAFYKCDAMESLVVPGAQTPVQGAFNVALDVGQYIAVGNPAHHALDPITTTVYCYKNSVAYSDVIQDSFCAYALLADQSAMGAGNVTSYTIRYTDESGADVAPSVTLNVQPSGIRVAAVATIPEDEELAYPETAAQTIELSENAAENTITFVYPVRTYTITFDANGGDEKEALVYSTTDDAVIGETTRHGYSLIGWEVVEAAADAHFNWGEVETTYAPTEAVTGKFGDVTLRAKWQANSVTVTFDATGGTADTEEMLVTFGETYGDLPGAVREGYTFDGWYTDGDVKIESATTVTVTEPQTLFAKWTINKYDVTVTTDGNGTAAADLTADVEYGTLVTLSAEPAAGYEFLAWECDDATITDNAFSMPDKAVTVHATFTATEYTITFDTDGGDEKAPMTYKITDTNNLGNAAKAGYTLICWNVSSPAGNWGSSGSSYAASQTVNGKYGNVAFKASWRANSIKVNYDAQGGTSAAESKNVTVGGTYGTLSTATREGYTFVGWYSAPTDDGVKIESTTTVTQTDEHTIYARWTINKYNITLATDNNGFVSADQTQDVAFGTVVTLETTAKPGYAFASWVSSDVTVEDNKFTMPDKAVRVRATFSPVAYTVTFDTDGGDAKDALAYNTTETSALGTATKDGYQFLYWQVSVPAAEGDYNWGGTQKTYLAEQTVFGKYGDVTLKAIWEGNAITVTYDAQGGSTTSPDKTVTVGSKYGTLLRATREGYTFNGWFTSAEGGTPVNADTIVTTKTDHSIFAHWTINKYNVTVTTDGNGTASADLTTDVEYGKVVTLTAEANTGYTFFAWESTTADIADNTFSMPDKAVTILATFTANNYTIAFDANGGENTMEAINAQYDTEIVLPACTFERAGWAFLGWAVADNAETPDYEDGAKVQNLTATADETVTLYAVWKNIKVDLIAKEESTTVIDEERGFIYGLDFDLTEQILMDQYLNVVGNGHLEFDKPDLGTGTKISVINDYTGQEDASYTIVIFGDVDCDGTFTPNDITQLRYMNAGMVERPEAGSAAELATDVDHDEVFGGPNDYTQLRYAKAGLREISQLMS